MVSRDTFFVLSVVALTLVLVLPVGRLIWALSVSRLQKRLLRSLEPNEIAAEKKRAYVIAAMVCLLFSLMFNARTLEWVGHG